MRKIYTRSGNLNKYPTNEEGVFKVGTTRRYVVRIPNPDFNTSDKSKPFNPVRFTTLHSCARRDEADKAYNEYLKSK
ncbi:hypothetical protein [Elizabethkingia phage TCUEAP1]|nr:hypothetical protein [Elizabethkingia phage TCUEAP1]